MSNPLRAVHARRAGLILALGCACAALPATADASEVNLATSAPFVVLAASTATNTGPSVLNGDLGVSPGSAIVGFGLPAVVNGATHANDAVAAQAQSDLTTAYGVAAGQPVTADLTGQDLGGKTLTAGAYRYASSAQLTGNLTLDAAGDPTAQFVFEIGSTLTTASASSVRLINGASPCNVFWQVGSSATLGTTTAFVGNLMALTSITLDNSAQLMGRALARNGAVTLDDNALDASMCATGAAGGTTGGSGTTTGDGTPGGGAGGTSGGGGQTTGGGGGTTTTSGPGPSRIGTAVLRHPAFDGRCLRGFHVTVRGRMIKKVVYSIAGHRLATRTHAHFGLSVRPAAGRRGMLTALVTFRDATRAKTLRFGYRACTAAVRRPAPGPSQFTG